MKTIPAVYQCEVCDSKYSTAEDALTCEAQGMRGEEYPIGMILGDKGGFYDGITFAIAEYHKRSGHDLYYTMWACRTTNGDSLGKNKCGSCNGNRTIDLIGNYCNHDLDSDHFKRMVAWLKEKGIPITVWNGKKPIPLAEYMNNLE